MYSLGDQCIYLGHKGINKIAWELIDKNKISDNISLMWEMGSEQRW